MHSVQVDIMQMHSIQIHSMRVHSMHSMGLHSNIISSINTEGSITSKMLMDVRLIIMCGMLSCRGRSGQALLPSRQGRVSRPLQAPTANPQWKPLPPLSPLALPLTPLTPQVKVSSVDASMPSHGSLGRRLSALRFAMQVHTFHLVHCAWQMHCLLYCA